MKLKGGTRPPWVGLGASVWLQVASGNAGTFSLYSHSLKSVLGFNQQQLTLLGVACDIGENMGLISGFICNKLPPWLIVFIGAVACFSGYGVLWLALSRTVHYLPFWLLWIALYVGTNSSTWFSTAVLVTNMRNFPLSRGTVTGVIKGYGGLSAAVYTEIYSVLLHNSSSKLLLFLTFGIPIISIILMYFLRPCTPTSGDDASEHSHFLFLQASSIVLGIYVLTATILSDVLPLSDSISYTLVVIMVLLLMAPLAIPIKMTLYPLKHRKSAAAAENAILENVSVLTECDADKTQPLLTPSSRANFGSFHENESMSDVDMLLAEGEGAIKRTRRPRRGEDFTFTEAIIKADFWLLFLVYFFGVGSGVTVMNNLAQIGIAQGVTNTNILLSLFSFGNFVGRLGGGILSEHFVRSKAIPRTMWMACTQLMMTIAYLLYASAIDCTVLVASSLLGICYGVQFSIMVPTASELFGLKHFGLIMNFICLGNPLGATLFSSLLAGTLYDNEASKQHAVTCLGPDCFRITFLVLAGVSFIGTLFSMVLTQRIKPVYQMLYSGGSFRMPQNSSR